MKLQGDSVNALIYSGVVQGLGTDLKAAPALDPIHASKVMGIVEDIVVQLRVLSIALDHSTDSKAYQLLQRSRAAMQMRSMLQGRQQLIVPDTMLVAP